MNNRSKKIEEAARAVEQACAESYFLSDRSNLPKPPEDYDEYDTMMRPLWDALRDALALPVEPEKGWIPMPDRDDIGWLANLTMACIDEGVDRPTAERTAARFMGWLTMRPDPTPPTEAGS